MRGADQEGTSPGGWLPPGDHLDGRKVSEVPADLFSRLIMALVVSNRTKRRPELLQMITPRQEHKKVVKEVKKEVAKAVKSRSPVKPAATPAPRLRSVVRGQVNKQAVKSAVRKVRSIKRMTSLALPVVAQYLDPLHSRPVRLPDANSAQTIGTAVAALSSSVKLFWDPTLTTTTGDWSARPDGSPFLADNATRVVFRTRDPVVPLIVSEFGGTTASTYIIAVTSAAGLTNANVKVAYDGVYLPFGAMTHMAGPVRYPTTTYPARINDFAYAHWIDASPSRLATLSVNATLVGSGASFELVWWNNPEAPVSLAVISAATAGAYSATFTPLGFSGYFSIRTSATNIIVNESAITVQLVVSVGQWFSQYPFPSYATAAVTGVIDTVRVLGDCLLAQNTSAEFAKNGAVYAVQSQNTDAWFEKDMSLLSLTSTNVRQYYQGVLSKGLYAIVKPQSANITSPFGMFDAGEEFPSGATTIASRPFHHAGFVTCAFVLGDPVSVATSSTSLQLHFMRSIEFTTDNQLYSVDVSRIPRSMYSKILDDLSACPQFFENPLHLAAIASLLASIGSWIWTNKTPLFNAVAAAHNAFHRSREPYPDAD